ncbi:MAG: hypothetical protein K0B87_03685 [Candidatus Syntrophosphaera sp.]|nr:hypothetical protein [Candidatus Syntrophosphaera sp.]
MALILLPLYTVLAILNALDGYSTWKVLRPDHFRRERNPLARFVFSKLGLIRGLILAEALWIGSFSLAFFLFWKDAALHSLLAVLLGIGVLAFAGIVVHNFRVYGRIKQREGSSPESPAQQEPQC